MGTEEAVKTQQQQHDVRQPGGSHSSKKDLVNEVEGQSQESQSKRPRLTINEYNGYTLPPSPVIDVLDATTTNPLSPEDFFHRYIAPRRPVLLRGYLNPATAHWSQLTSLADLAFLKSKAAEAEVRVEKRVANAPGHRVFGRGQEVVMRFGDLLEEWEKGSEDYYLTTQELPIGPDDRPAIMSSPVTQLMGCFPLRPAIMGALIPQNINLWMGQSQGPTGTSTGLHHDYHDNLYVLLKGSKRFRLHSPADALKMSTVGNIIKVHPNGRINYEGQRMTEADGRDVGADKARKAAQELEKAALQAFGKKEGEQGVLGEEEAEAQLEAALDAVLDAEMEDVDPDGDGDDDDDDEKEGREGQTAGNGKKEEEGEEETAGRSEPPPSPEEVVDSPPDNFSRVDLSLPKEALAQDFPEFLEATCLECELKEGELLYLPAGWFHEVRSGGGLHVAFNYWYHPPTAMGDPQHPYLSDFWVKDWEERGL